MCCALTIGSTASSVLHRMANCDGNAGTEAVSWTVMCHFGATAPECGWPIVTTNAGTTVISVMHLTWKSFDGYIAPCADPTTCRQQARSAIAAVGFRLRHHYCETTKHASWTTHSRLLVARYTGIETVVYPSIQPYYPNNPIPMSHAPSQVKGIFVLAQEVFDTPSHLAELYDFPRLE